MSASVATLKVARQRRAGPWLAEVFLGVNAEQQSLEDVAAPLSEVDSGDRDVPGGATSSKK